MKIHTKLAWISPWSFRTAYGAVSLDLLPHPPTNPGVERADLPDVSTTLGLYGTWWSWTAHYRLRSTAGGGQTQSQALAQRLAVTAAWHRDRKNHFERRSALAQGV
jgi:hypothetical protein